jgi:hypothetical protein
MRATRVWECLPAFRNLQAVAVWMRSWLSTSNRVAMAKVSLMSPLSMNASIELGARSSKLPLQTHRLANLCP